MKTPKTQRPIAGTSGAARLPPDTLVNMAWLAGNSGMSDKWFYKLIARGEFMPPIKFGCHSRWRVGDYYAWLDAQHQQAVQVMARRSRSTPRRARKSRQSGGDV